MRNWGRTCCGCAAIFRQQEDFFHRTINRMIVARQKCLHEKLIEWNGNECLHILVPLSLCMHSFTHSHANVECNISNEISSMNFLVFNWFKSTAIFISINYRTSHTTSSMAREWTDCRWASGAANWWFNRESIDVASSTKVWFKFNIYLSSDKYATCRSERDQLCTGSTL